MKLRVLNNINTIHNKRNKNKVNYNKFKAIGNITNIKIHKKRQKEGDAQFSMSYGYSSYSDVDANDL